MNVIERIECADDVCAHMSKNMEIDFKINGENMTRETAKKHFQDRAAITRVRNLLIDEGERILNLTV